MMTTPKMMTITKLFALTMATSSAALPNAEYSHQQHRRHRRRLLEGCRLLVLARDHNRGYRQSPTCDAQQQPQPTIELRMPATYTLSWFEMLQAVTMMLAWLTPWQWCIT